MLNIFEYDEQTDWNISYLLALLKEKDLKYEKELGYFIINSVHLIKEMFYGADVGPHEESLFKEFSQDLGEYLKNASREQLFQLIVNLGWLFVAVFALKNKKEAKDIKSEAVKAFGISSLSEQSFDAIYDSPKFDLFSVFSEFNKICSRILKKEGINDPRIGFIFCASFGDKFLHAMTHANENKLEK